MAAAVLLSRLPPPRVRPPPPATPRPWPPPRELSNPLFGCWIPKALPRELAGPDRAGLDYLHNPSSNWFRLIPTLIILAATLAFLPCRHLLSGAFLLGVVYRLGLQALSEAQGISPAAAAAAAARAIQVTTCRTSRYLSGCVLRGGSAGHLPPTRARGGGASQISQMPLPSSHCLASCGFDSRRRDTSALHLIAN